MGSKFRIRPDPKDFQFCKRKGEVLFKLPGSINGLDFILEDLTDCKVYLLDHSSQVQIDNCRGCEIFIGPVDGSAFFRDCAKCKVAVACRQLRTRDCKNVDFSLHVATNPIIESSSGVRICPWTPSYSEAESHFKSANLKPEKNNWDSVYDFTPPAAGEAPHWAVLEEKDWPAWPVPSFQAKGDDAAAASENGHTAPCPNVSELCPEVPESCPNVSESLSFAPPGVCDARFAEADTTEDTCKASEMTSLEPALESKGFRNGLQEGLREDAKAERRFEVAGDSDSIKARPDEQQGALTVDIEAGERSKESQSEPISGVEAESNVLAGALGASTTKGASNGAQGEALVIQERSMPKTERAPTRKPGMVAAVLGRIWRFFSRITSAWRKAPQQGKRCS